MRRTFRLMFLLVGSAFMANAQGSTDSFTVYFDFAAATLNPAQQKTLDSLWDQVGRAGDINIIGYADEPGTAASNKVIAYKRAVSVRNWLIASGMDKAGIRKCAGVGNSVHSGKDIQQRRVDIIFMKKKVDDVPVASSLGNLGNMKVNETIALNNLMFIGGMPILLPESVLVIDTLYNVLKSTPKLVIHIEGHVCCGVPSEVGRPASASVVFQLSEDRAHVIYDSLIARGISAKRLSYEGFGFSRPKIYPERNMNDQALNRRVEIRVVSNDSRPN